jgi:predicted transcriptional regulator
MKISEIAAMLDAEVFCGKEWMDRDVYSGFGCDMMSDVLAFVKDSSILLTGLINPQVIRTAEMMDIICIVFIRGKAPTEAMIKLAEERSIVLLSTKHIMFSACGILFNAGIRSGGSV